ncbi:alpha-L-rhamnosidase [Faecalicatena sp. AGMB00832]|uniref:Alpha-L-rhamnosidase n=1 Tax=Faecalicatena faecalis TaxID=2726362 RepID=A0ABS6CZH6_9FIRM|nr:alpha-L-rhamnosidase C-terminal domain-containing protein [Faecalicatena faecalis]MBU3874525.1 alpha-L-rhamnosidase [Faecalicatena faecalis]
MSDNGLVQNDIFRSIPERIAKTAQKDERARAYLIPQKVLWETNDITARVIDSHVLLEQRSPQISLDSQSPCILCNDGQPASILLDFGCEIHGGIVIHAWKETTGKGAKVRVRFGESALEAMSELGGIQNATNDHANRDMIVRIGNMSMNPIGETGFRFVRIDLLEPYQQMELKAVQAVLIYKDLEYKGSFHCSDELLNRIWNTGAYTVHLNTQNYIWDGIKRDRLVWAGDLHPEITAIKTVFGNEEAVPKSLDFVRNETPLPGWMNDFPAYSMWWAIIQYDWFLYTGDFSYLKEQHHYLRGLQEQMSSCIGEDGKDNTPETRFVDWPSKANPGVVDAGLQALHILATSKMEKLFEQLEDEEMAEICRQDLGKLRKYKANFESAKQAAALMVLSGMEEAVDVNEKLLRKNGSKGMSTFMGYYILSARAKAGDYQGCLESIREYWGGMLALGATTFWEDFDIEWLKDALPIDAWKREEGKIDVHGTYGGYCYCGYRHSLCHGWAAGVTPWLSENVLGVKILEPGCKKVQINPHLGDLDFAEGTYPTPYGKIHIHHVRKPDGEIESRITAPKEIIIVQGEQG